MNGYKIRNVNNTVIYYPEEIAAPLCGGTLMHQISGDCQPKYLWIFVPTISTSISKHLGKTKSKVHAHDFHFDLSQESARTYRMNGTKFAQDRRRH